MTPTPRQSPITEAGVEAACWELAKHQTSSLQLREIMRLVLIAAEKASWQPSHRHVKRGTDYVVVGQATIQDSTGSYLGEACPVTVYRNKDGRLWVRATDEFNDGRFVALPAAPDAGGEG